MADRNLDLWISDQLYALLGACPHKHTSLTPQTAEELFRFCLLRRHVVQHVLQCFLAVCGALSLKLVQGSLRMLSSRM